MKQLDISENYILDLSPLSGMSGLELLNAKQNRIRTTAGLPVSLKQLELSNNMMTSCSSLASLTNLEVLKIGNNPITDFSGIRSLGRLSFIDISNVNEVGSFSFLSSLNSLETVLASDCGLTSLDGLQGKALAYLEVSRNHLTSLAGLNGTELLYCRASQNSLNDISALGNASKLQRLYLDRNVLGADQMALMSSNSLEILDASDNEIATTEWAGKLSQLKYLKLSGNALTDCTSVGQLGNLLELYLDNCQLTDATVGQLTGLTKVQYIVLNGNLFSDIIALQNCGSLSKLEVSNTYVDSGEWDSSFEIARNDDMVLPRRIELDLEELSLKVGERQLVTYCLYPYNTTEQKVTWTSSDNKIASVSSTGKISGISNGQATITATTVNGFAAVCTVQV